MQTTSVSHIIRRHGMIILASGMALIALVGMTESKITASVSHHSSMVDIAIEHQQPVSVSLSLSTLRGQTLVDIAHSGKETIHISIPSSWKRHEVRNAPLKDVVSDPAVFGFTRWHFPPESGVIFVTDTTPENFLVHNPTKVPLKMSYTLVDLERESVEHDVVLVKDEAVQLW